MPNPNALPAPQGVYGKYRVTKADGSELDGPCFVLRYDRDEHAAAALMAYINSVRDENADLAHDLEMELAFTKYARWPTR